MSTRPDTADVLNKVVAALAVQAERIDTAVTLVNATLDSDTTLTQADRSIYKSVVRAAEKISGLISKACETEIPEGKISPARRGRPPKSETAAPVKRRGRPPKAEAKAKPAKAAKAAKPVKAAKPKAEATGDAPKRRGRPPKAKTETTAAAATPVSKPKVETTGDAPKRRGRPPKVLAAGEVPKKRGRPKKVTAPVESTETVSTNALN